MRSKTVRISARQANLKRRLRRHLSAVGFHKGKDGGLEISGPGKEVIRELHRAHRNERVREDQTFIAEIARRAMCLPPYTVFCAANANVFAIKAEIGDPRANPILLPSLPNEHRFHPAACLH